jgi:uncharacterized protein YggE
MTQPATTLLSVRGEAAVVVPPDEAQLSCVVRASAHDRGVSVDIVGQRLAALASALADRGGAVRTAESVREALTWSAFGIRTREESDGAKNGAGTFSAAVTVRIFVREVNQLETVVSAVSYLDGVEMWTITWTVDDDNPAWAQVRAEAIRSALRRGADYARALGGEITAVQHVADAGLLGDSGAVPAARAGASGGGEGGGVSLTPEPQRLTAVIDARFVATVGSAALDGQGS